MIPEKKLKQRRPLRERVRTRRRKVEAEQSGLNAAQSRLHDAGFQSLFCHTQGDGNVFILWINMQTGAEVLTVSGRGPTIEGEDIRNTGIYRLYPVIDQEEFFQAEKARSA